MYNDQIYQYMTIIFFIIIVVFSECLFFCGYTCLLYRDAKKMVQFCLAKFLFLLDKIEHQLTLLTRYNNTNPYQFSNDKSSTSSARNAKVGENIKTRTKERLNFFRRNGHKAESDISFSEIVKKNNGVFFPYTYLPELVSEDERKEIVAFFDKLDPETAALRNNPGYDVNNLMLFIVNYAFEHKSETVSNVSCMHRLPIFNEILSMFSASIGSRVINILNSGTITVDTFHRKRLEELNQQERDLMESESDMLKVECIQMAEIMDRVFTDSPREFLSYTNSRSYINMKDKDKAALFRKILSVQLDSADPESTDKKLRDTGSNGISETFVESIDDKVLGVTEEMIKTPEIIHGLFKKTQNHLFFLWNDVLSLTNDRVEIKYTDMSLYNNEYVKFPDALSSIEKTKGALNVPFETIKKSAYHIVRLISFTLTAKIAIKNNGTPTVEEANAMKEFQRKIGSVITEMKDNGKDPEKTLSNLAGSWRDFCEKLPVYMLGIMPENVEIIGILRPLKPEAGSITKITSEFMKMTVMALGIKGSLFPVPATGYTILDWFIKSHQTNQDRETLKGVASDTIDFFSRWLLFLSWYIYSSPYHRRSTSNIIL